MNKSPPGEDLPALFRSLRPDNTNFQTTLDTAAHEAEQRWPLFKAISPKTPELTPALTAEERLQWSFQQRPSQGDRKPALARLGLSDKLTKSLGKMSGLETKPHAANTLTAPVPAPVAVAQSKPERKLLLRNSEPASPKPAQSPVMLFSTPVRAAVPQVELEVDVEIEVEVEAEIIPPKVAPQVLLKQPEPKADKLITPVVTDDSLAGIFGRLLEKETIVSKPVAKKSSFLGRLGKK